MGGGRCGFGTVSIGLEIRLGAENHRRLCHTTCQTGASAPDSGDSTAVAALIDQLAWMDKQIDRLRAMAADSTKAVQGARALHHETA